MWATCRRRFRLESSGVSCPGVSCRLTPQMWLASTRSQGFQHFSDPGGFEEVLFACTLRMCVASWNPVAKNLCRVIQRKDKDSSDLLPVSRATYIQNPQILVVFGQLAAATASEPWSPVQRIFQVLEGKGRLLPCTIDMECRKGGAFLSWFQGSGFLNTASDLARWVCLK